ASPTQANRRLLRSYGPLLAVAVAFTVMAVSVSTVPRQHLAYAGSVNVPDVAGTGGTGGGGATTGGTGTTGGGGTGGSATTGGAGNGGSTGGTGGGSVGGVTACKDRAQQVPGDPYSPPCYAFSGNNGGATS